MNQIDRYLHEVEAALGAENLTARRRQQVMGELRKDIASRLAAGEEDLEAIVDSLGTVDSHVQTARELPDPPDGGTSGRQALIWLAIAAGVGLVSVLLSRWPWLGLLFASSAIALSVWIMFRYEFKRTVIMFGMGIGLFGLVLSVLGLVGVILPGLNGPLGGVNPGLVNPANPGQSEVSTGSISIPPPPSQTDAGLPGSSEASPIPPSDYTSYPATVQTVDPPPAGSSPSNLIDLLPSEHLSKPPVVTPL